MRLLVITAFLLLSLACQQSNVSVNPAKNSNQSNLVSNETTKIENTKVENTNKVEAKNPFKDDQAKSAENKSVSTPANGIEKRCGWLANPTPANFWLNDAEGEWTISVQGGYQAEGTDYLPDFGNEWVKTNGNYGYGCMCMDAKVDKKEMRVTEIKKASVRPLSACRNDKNLKDPKAD